MPERPDLDGLKERAKPATIHSDTQGWLAGHLIEVCAYALATEARLAAALEVVETARSYRRCEIGSGQRLMDAVDLFDGKAEPEEEYEWPVE